MGEEMYGDGGEIGGNVKRLWSEPQCFIIVLSVSPDPGFMGVLG